MNVSRSAMPAPGVRVWDLPTRLFHWSMVICFVGAWLTREGDGQRLLHVLFGYTLFGLIGIRLIWGVIGTRYARFAEFIRGPRAVIDYLSGKATRYIGHNPAGAIAIVLMLALGLGSGITGWLMASGRAGEGLEDIHEFFANGSLAVVIVHVLGVIWSSLRHRENLPRAMLTGKKTGQPTQGIAHNHAWLAWLLLAAILAFWGSSWRTQQLPMGLDAGVQAGHDGEHADDHDDD